MKEMKCNEIMQDCGIAPVRTRGGSKPVEPLLEHKLGRVFPPVLILIPSLELLLLCAAVWTLLTELIKAKIKAWVFCSTDVCVCPHHTGFSPVTHLPTGAMDPATSDIGINRLLILKLLLPVNWLKAPGPNG